MLNMDSLFFQNSKKIAEDFLQTSVIVDDQAYFDTNKSNRKKAQPIQINNLVTPGRRGGKDLGKNVPSKLVVSLSDLDDEKSSHVLDAQRVINNFAEKRIVCSIIKPGSGNNWISSVENLASSVDILILDWDIKQDNGRKTKSLLGKILKSSNERPRQLRLLVIYTGDPKIAEISREIKVLIQNKLKVPAKKIEEQDDGFALVYGSTRIAIYSKPGTENLLKDYENRRVRFEDLADRVTSEFTVMTTGLVSNVAISSLALIRNNTHKILNKFSSYLDAPYLTHRALQVTPEDAEEFLTELIADELWAILDEESIGKGANLESIRQWLLANNKASFDLDVDPKTKISFTSNEALELLKTGLNDCNKISSTKRERPHRLPFTEMFRPQGIIHQSLDERFSLITTIRTHYEKKKPKLTFGTILHKVKDNSYWVCIQPRCDSIRIESERAFPLLPLIISKVDQKFRLVLEENTGHIRLSLKEKPYDLNLISFLSRPENHGTITANLSKGSYYFTSTKRVRYKWVGELRPQHVQRLANEFAANLARVGLDESEWLRLWATKG